MKKCSFCKKELPLESFYEKGKENRKQSYCKVCLCKVQTERWIERKKWAVNYKGGICMLCKKEFPYYVYDFHHVDRKNKLYSWNKMRLVSINKLKLELDKCELLCANCHRIKEHAFHYPLS